MRDRSSDELDPELLSIPSRESEDEASPPARPAASEAAPWFGYIGVGIAVAAMILGIVGMVLVAIYMFGWITG